MLYFIVNEHSGSGRGVAIWKEIKEELKKRGVQYKAWTTEYAGHAFALSERICGLSDKRIILVVVGGDGTVNEVINGMSHFEKVRFGLIPTGSGNDFARGLGLKKAPVEALDAILNCKEDFVMDLGEVSWDGGKRLYAISAGLGLDALVCKRALKSVLKNVLNKLRLGKLTYLLLTVWSLFTMQTAEAKAFFDGSGQRNLRGLIFTAAMNFPAEGGGVPMAPRASASDGRLSVCCAWGIPKWRTFFCLPFLVAAKHEGIRGFEVTDCARCEVKTDVPMVLHADGEYCADVTEARFRCIPAKLHIMK